MKQNIITIDGPAASGKGTLARRLADHLNYFYLDTGKIYRLIGLQAHQKGLVPEDNPNAVAKLAQDFAANFDLSMMDNPELKSDHIGQMASRSGAFPVVRAAILDLQRHLSYQPPYGDGVVLDGRDCGTVICPDAQHKFFITADVEIRAKRRFEELKSADPTVEYQAVLDDMKKRDERDSVRAAAPLKPADDAFVIDTSALSGDQAYQAVLDKL
jgi:cytidylate kinase